MNIFNFQLKSDKKRKYLLFDTETESLNLVGSRPWQIAYGLYSLEEGCIWSKERYIQWNDLRMSAGAAKQTQFNQVEYLSKAEDRHDVWADFSKYLYDDKLTSMAHNGLGFDVYMINNWRLGMGLKTDYSFVPRLLDTNCMGKAYKFDRTLDLKIIHQQMYRFSGEFKRGVRTSIKELAKEFGIVRDEAMAHKSAQYDNDQMWAVFQELLKRVKFV